MIKHIDKIIKQIDKQMKLLKELGFDIVTTYDFDEVLKDKYLLKPCYTHNIQYLPYVHLNYCYLCKIDGKYKYVIRISSLKLPEEVIKIMELLGYSHNADILVYEGKEDDD